MSKKKDFLFTKFIKENNSKSNNELLIHDSKNIKICDKKIYSWNSYTNTINYLFDNEDSEIILSQNRELLNRCIRIFPYDYFDENENKIKSRVFVLDSNFELFELENDTKIFIKKHTFLNENFKTFSLKNSMYFLCKTGECLIVNNSDEIVSKFMPKFDKIFHENNTIIFNTFDEPFRVYFAEENNIENVSLDLTKYDYFDINFSYGNLVSITKILNKIYIICSYKILTIDTEEKRLNISQNLSFQILNNSVQKHEDYIVFFANKSIYSFDGNNIKLLSDKIKINLINNANSFTFNDKYYIFAANNKDFIHEIDLNNFELNILYFENLVDIHVIKTLLYHNLFLTNKDRNNTYNNITITNDCLNHFESMISFEELSFETLSKKQIQTLEINAKGSYEFLIKSDMTSYSFSGNNSTILNNINLVGNKFTFSLKFCGDFSLENIGIKVLFLED